MSFSSFDVAAIARTHVFVICGLRVTAISVLTVMVVAELHHQCAAVTKQYFKSFQLVHVCMFW